MDINEQRKDLKPYYMLVADGGDGSSRIEFFDNLADVEACLDEDESDNLETYGCNEGSYDTIYLPKDLDPKIAGIRLRVCN